MDVGKAVLLDILNFLPIVEDRIKGDHTDVSDILEITRLRQSLNMLERMASKCDASVSVEDYFTIHKRIAVAKETVDLLSMRISGTKCTSQFMDVASLPERRSQEQESALNYANGLHLTNDDFDSLIEEWASDTGKTVSSPRGRKKSKALGNQQEQIRSDLIKLADTMKSKALWYRDILVKDNEALSKYTVEQEKQLDTVANVAKEASKLTKTARVSLYQSLIMVASMFLIVLMMMFVFIVT